MYISVYILYVCMHIHTYIHLERSRRDAPRTFYFIFYFFTLNAAGGRHGEHSQLVLCAPAFIRESVECAGGVCEGGVWGRR